jgi:nucleotide-binding universal stress UspA family protein
VTSAAIRSSRGAGPVVSTDVAAAGTRFALAMPDTIIGALDLDAPDQARDALALAAWLAEMTASELMLVTVFAPHAGALSPQIERRRRRLAALSGSVEALAIAGTSPARVLHELADQRHPLALVVGSSRGGANGVVSVGSASELLLHGSPVPVAVAPNGFTVPSRRTVDVGVAYGTTPESDDAVRVAAALAGQAGASLRVLRVDEPAPHNDLAEHHPGERLERALAGRPAQYAELSGDPAAALAAASDDLDLLVAGSRSYGPLGAVLLGAVTRRLMRAARCPVLLVPRTRDSAWFVALVGGMDATVDA